MANKNRFSSTPSGSIGPWLGLAAIVILLDQVSKITISKMLVYGAEQPIGAFFNLVLAHNKGAAFNFLAAESGWQRYFLTALGVGAALFIIYLLKKNAGQRLFCWALALIMGGALGNAIDRVLYGYVIDFLDVHFGGWHWPAFNVADSAICIGAALFVFDELRRVNK